MIHYKNIIKTVSVGLPPEREKAEDIKDSMDSIIHNSLFI